MYSVMLAAMLTTTGAAPDWGWGGGCYGCHGCCGGCYGGCYGYNAFSYSCHGCCGGCWGCCGGCWGCWGGPVVYSYGSCYGCCGGYYGGVIMTPAVDVQPAATAREKALQDEIKELKERLKKLEKGGRDEVSAPAPAHVVVKLPTDARLFVDDVACPLTSERSEFDTPALKPEVTYGYTIRAEATRDGRRVSESKKVTVRAGKETVVEFGDLRPVLTAGR